MPAGRPPKPTRLKVLQGNPGRRKLPTEPKLPSGASPPAWLTAEELKHWDEVAPMLTEAGLLKRGDAQALGMYCHLLVKMIHQMKEGVLDLGVSREWRQYVNRFGMTPADRAKVGPGDVPPADPFEAFLVGGKKA